MFQDQLREVVAHVKRVQQKQQEAMGKVQQTADSVAEQQRALEAQQEVFEVSIGSYSYAHMYIVHMTVLYDWYIHITFMLTQTTCTITYIWIYGQVSV